MQPHLSDATKDDPNNTPLFRDLGIDFDLNVQQLYIPMK